MESFSTNAIILRRIDYGEADKIVTFLTPEHGQIRAIAKGVRRAKSKLAGGLALLSVSQVTYMKSRGDLYLVRSARMESHFGDIITDYDRMQFAYAAIGALYIMTEDINETGMYELLHGCLRSLDDTSIPLDVVMVWFYMQALRAIGQQPNLETDSAGLVLTSDVQYDFDSRHGGFVASAHGKYNANHIKALRLLLRADPAVSSKVRGLESHCEKLVAELKPMFDRILALGA